MKSRLKEIVSRLYTTALYISVAIMVWFVPKSLYGIYVIKFERPTQYWELTPKPDEPAGLREYLKDEINNDIVEDFRKYGSIAQYTNILILSIGQFLVLIVGRKWIVWVLFGKNNDS